MSVHGIRGDPENLIWSDDETIQAKILNRLTTVDIARFLRYKPNEKGDSRYLPDALTWDHFYKPRVEEEVKRGNFYNVIALLDHHRGQFGDDTPRIGGLHGMETQGPRDALVKLVRTINLTVEPGLESTLRIFEAKLVQAETEYRLSNMSRADRMAEYMQQF